MVSDAETLAAGCIAITRTQPDTNLGPVSGAMGYGVPGGVGAQVARPDRAVFVWVGDGGFR